MVTIPQADDRDEHRTRRSRRAARYRERRFLWDWSSQRRLRGCGRRRIDSGAGVGIAVGDGVAHYRNVQRCGLVHVCPACAAKIRQERADEIGRAGQAHLEQGGGLTFVTLTLPHDEGDRLAGLLDAVAAAFRALLSGRAAIARRATFGIVGTIRSLEVNIGANGWHPHLHVLVFTARPLDEWQREMLRVEWLDVWSRHVVGRGYRAPSAAHGVDVRPVTDAGALGEYVTKVRREAMELTRHDLKRGRAGSRSAWQVLEDVVRWGDADDLAIWWEYEKATKGRQAITWSHGLKARFAVEDRSDEDIAEQVEGGEVVAVVEPELWNFVCRGAGRGVVSELLDLAERDPAAVAERLWRLDEARRAHERNPWRRVGVG